MLVMKNITKVFRTETVETHALKRLVSPLMKVISLLSWPSGSGKTTFLNIAGLLESFDDGEYRDGRSVGT